MGVDFAIANAATAMLDQRSQPITYDNKWFSRQVTDQQYFVMNVLNNCNGRETPLGPVNPAEVWVGCGNFSPSRPPSHHSTTTDAFDDPNGTIMDNGNGHCQSPGLDSIYSTNLGTPNSFIADVHQDSPRERLMSVSSSTYTYSPYNPHEDDLSCNVVVAPPRLQRQPSSEMVEQYFLNENSPGLAACTDESGLSYNNSQGFSIHYDASTEAAQQAYLSSSQNQEIIYEFLNNVNVNDLGILQLEGSPTTESSQQSTSKSDTDASNCGTASPVTVPASTSQNFLTPTTQCLQSQMTRQISSLSDIISETIPTNSQDAPMMQECMAAFANSQTFPTLNMKAIEETPQQHAIETAAYSTAADVTSPHGETNAENFNSFPPNSEDDVVTARRERNNAACRASRKRRKEKKTEMEKSISRYENENEQLKREIERLEVECKRVKRDIFAHMNTNAR